MHGVGVAKEVMQITKNFLVRTRQEDAQHVIFAVAKLVHFEARAPLLASDKAIDLAIGIAGHVLQRPAPNRLLVQTMNGHDRKELIDGPAVRQRLEQREVAEVAVN